MKKGRLNLDALWNETKELLIHEKEPLCKYFVYGNDSLTFVFPSGDATSVLKMSGVIDGRLSLAPEPA